MSYFYLHTVQYVLYRYPCKTLSPSAKKLKRNDIFVLCRLLKCSESERWSEPLKSAPCFFNRPIATTRTKKTAVSVNITSVKNKPERSFFSGTFYI